MSEYAQLAAKFLERYEKPVVEEYIQGFSGIDPQRIVNASDLNHEQLYGLLGGNTNEHYHLTKAQYEWLVEQMSGGGSDDNYAPVITAGQVINVIQGEEMTPYEISGTNLR